MDIKESYRLLELEVGASRDAIETAYCRLLERWHPERITPAGDPNAVRKANEMVQAINEAYRNLLKVAPAPAPTKPPFNSAPSPAGRPTSAPPPPPKSVPEPRAPEPAPATVIKAAPEAPPAGRPKDAWSPGDTLLAKFPPGSAARKFGPIIAAVVILLLGALIFTQCSSKPKRTANAPDPKTTGRLIVKTNRPDTVVEANLVQPTGEKAPAATNFKASGTEATFPGLPPGKYSLIAKAAGWTDIKQDDVTVVVGSDAEVTMQFKSGSLKLDSIPDKALVRWGEIDLGRTPVVIPALPVGENQLTLEYPSWPVQPVKVTIVEGVETAETIRLPHGRLIVESTPSGATVQLEAKVIGQTPLTIERMPTGTRKITIRAPEFVPVAFAVTIEDKGEAKLNPVLVSSMPVLEPGALLTAVWMEATGDRGLAPGFNQTINFRSKNGVVKNLNRKKLWESWLNKKFRFTGTIKSYDRNTGKIEFIDEDNELAKYRVSAVLSISSRSDKDVVARLTKGATLPLYAQLDAVEEPNWPAKTISIELINAEPQQ